MRDFEDSTLWRVSEFERLRNETGSSGYMRLEGPSVLPTTLLNELNRLEKGPDAGDVLEVMAACLRQRDAALLYLKHDDVVWPLTLFPLQMLYHSPRDFATASTSGLAQLELLGIEPPGVRPPGHWLYERVGQTMHYRPLMPLLWQVALHGPRRTLLAEIGGTAAYRVIRRLPQDLVAPGALGPAIERLARDAAPLREIAQWPGMNVERATRLLNGLYISQCLLATRAHPAARAEPGLARRWFGKKR